MAEPTPVSTGSITENVLIVAIPNGLAPGSDSNKARLKISVVLSPFAQYKGTPPENRDSIWKDECVLLMDWVQKTRTWKLTDTETPPANLQFTFHHKSSDAPPKDAVWKRGDEVKGKILSVTPDWSVLESLEFPEKSLSPAKPTFASFLGQGTALWNFLFGPNNKDIWISPEMSGTVEPGKNFVARDPKEVNQVLRRNAGNTIEGITSDEMKLLVACGMAVEVAITTKRAAEETAGIAKPVDVTVAAASAARELLPPAVMPAWNQALRRMDHVIQRQEKVGTAGGFSQTLQNELEGTRKAGVEEQSRKLGQEFHHRMAMLDNHPPLLRLLGLIVDVIVEVDLTGPLSSGPEFFLQGELKMTGSASLKCISQSTACVLIPPDSKADTPNRKEGMFHTAVKDDAGRLSAEDRCVQPEYLDTAQWNLESGVRSVLRRHGFLRGAGTDGGATLPGGVGISVFWREKARPVSTDPKPREALLVRHREDLAKGGQTKGMDAIWNDDNRCFFADDLVMGYVPAIRRADGGSGWKWSSVTGRKLSLRIPGETPAATPKNIVWTDEMALMPASAEAPQPLSGWIVDVLRKDAPDPMPTHDESWYYLVATSSGFVVVRENVTVDYRNLESGPIRIKTSNTSDEKERAMAIWDWLPVKEAEAEKRLENPLARMGKYVDLHGRWEKAKGYFLIDNATLVPGSGLAGKIPLDPGVSVHALTLEGWTMIKIPILQKAVNPLTSKVRPGLTKDYPIPSYAFLRGQFTLARDKIKTTVAEHLRDGPLHFQGRGDKAMAIVEKFVDEKASTMLRLPTAPSPLRYIGQDGDLRVFAMEGTEDQEIDTTLAERLRTVKLRLAKNVDIQTLVKTTDDGDPLVPTSIYQVSCRLEDDENGKAEFLVVHIVEMAPATIVTFLRMEKTMIGNQVGHLAVFGTGSNQELSCLVDPKKTRVIFPGLPDTAGGFLEGNDDPWSPAFSAGAWEDLGIRLGAYDQCRIQVSPGAGKIEGAAGSQQIYHLSEVRVLWPDTTHTQYAIHSPAVDLAENEIHIEYVLPGKPQAPPQRERMMVKDTTEIISLPWAAPGTAAWKQWNHVPPEAGLLRISDTGNGNKRIELINVIQSRISEIKDDAEVPQLKVNFPGAGRQSFGLPFDKTGSCWTAFSKRVDELANFTNGNRAMVLKKLQSESEMPGHAATIRVDSRNQIHSLTLRVAGLLQGSGKDTTWQTPGGLKIPLTNLPENTGDILSITFENGFVKFDRSLKPAAAPLLIQVHEIAEQQTVNPETKKKELVHDQATALVIQTPSRSTFEPGTFVPTIVEVFADEGNTDKVKARRGLYSRYLRAAMSSGFPLQGIAEPAILVDNAHLPAADWVIVKLSTKQKAPPTRVGEKDSKDLGWLQIQPEVVITGEDFNEAAATQTPEEFFSLVIKEYDKDNRRPPFDYSPPFHDDLRFNPGGLNDPEVPKNDQIIADDMLMQWNGWSLAVVPPHRANGWVSPTEGLPVQATPHPKLKLPALRCGSGYELAMRVMDIAGNFTPLTKYAEKAPCSFRFEPFGKGREKSSPATLLRFSPIAPPLVWQSSPLLDHTEPKQANPALITVLTLFTDRAGLLTSPSSLSAPVEISLMPPPAHWRVGEMLGEFDGKTPKDIWTRISSGTDWKEALPYKRQWTLQDAKTRRDSFVPDAVMDPDVQGILITSNLPGESLVSAKEGGPPDPKVAFIMSVDQRRTTPKQFTISRAPDDPNPVSHNVPLDRPADLEKLPDSLPGKLEFPPDVDVQLRFHGLPARGKTAASYEAFFKKHQLGGFLSWVAQGKGDELAEAFKALSDHGDFALTNTSTLKEEIGRIVEDLMKLRPDAEKMTSKEYSRAMAAFLSHPWVSTPRMLRVRHVTNQPYQAPVAVALELLPRMPGQQFGDFRANFQVHRPSTGYLTVQTAMAQEYVDDPRNDLPTVPDEEQVLIYEDPVMRRRALGRIRKLFDHVEALRSGTTLEGKKVDIKRQDLTAKLFLGRTAGLETLLMRPTLDLGLITPSINSRVDPFGDPEVPVSFVHDFQDTRHRTVYYRGIAHTRYGKEVVPAAHTETMPRTENHFEETDGWRQVEIPATVAPTTPNVTDITVLFDWSRGGWRDGLWVTAGSKSWSFSRTRRCGHRMWLERPWYTSGSGEKLAVLLWMDASIPWSKAAEYCHLVSTWGVDPAFETQLPADKFKNHPEHRPGLLSRRNFVETWSTPLGLEARRTREEKPNPSGVETEEQTPKVEIVDADHPLPVGLAVYTPRFHPERRLWYVDVFTEPRSYSPFISYMVARYQPCSIKGMALSVPQRLRMLQALPVRTITVQCSNNGIIEIKVQLSGIFPDQNHRRVVVTIEKNPFLEEIAREELEKDSDFNGYEFGWEPVRIQDGTGVSGDSVTVTDPEVKTSLTQPNGTVEVTVRLPYVPTHRSVMEVLENAREQEHEWPCRFLRLCVAEQELFPCSHHMLEDVREMPREIFSDQVLLPVELLDAAEIINPVNTYRPTKRPRESTSTSSP